MIQYSTPWLNRWFNTKHCQSKESCRTCEWAVLHIWVGHVTYVWMRHKSPVILSQLYSNEWVVSHAYEWVMSHTYEWDTRALLERYCCLLENQKKDQEWSPIEWDTRALLLHDNIILSQLSSTHDSTRGSIQPIALGNSLNLNLQSQSHWSLFNGTWQKRPRELDSPLRFEIEEMSLQMH